MCLLERTTVFDQLLKGLTGAMNPFQGFMADLWNVWQTDAARAVLIARWYWQSLPAELAQQATMLQQQQRSALEGYRIDREVDAQLGAMGIFPSSSSSSGGYGMGTGMSMGVGMNPDQSVFLSVMALVRAHDGDPPAAPAAVSTAEQVLRGQLDPEQALTQLLPPQVQQQLAMAAQAMQMMGTGNLLRLQGVVNAAASLPRERIPVLFPDVVRAKHG